jgi:hypothetical protein
LRNLAAKLKVEKAPVDQQGIGLEVSNTYVARQFALHLDNNQDKRGEIFPALERKFYGYSR